jgi:hypothetical protein
MKTMFVRLKPYDPRRGHVLRRYTYRGIKFHEDRGWFRVPKDVADYLRSVHEVPGDEHSPLAFDCCTEAEAKSLDAKEKESAVTRKTASDDIKVSLPQEDGKTPGALTTSDLQSTSDERAKSRQKKG